MRRLLLIVLLIGVFFALAHSDAFAANLYWVGSDGAATNVASNWKTTDPATCGGGDAGAAPGTADVAIFDPDCDNGAAVTGSFDVGGVSIVSGYTGTITQNAVAMTIRGSGWTQADGTFTGNSEGSTANFTFQSGGDFNLSGGTFTATNDTTRVPDNFTISGSPAFSANSGTFVFDVSTDDTTTISGSATFNNLTFAEECLCVATVTIASSTIVTVTGTLLIDGDDGNWGPDELNGPGVIYAQGHITTDDDGWTGDITITINGSGDQTFTGTGTGFQGYGPEIPAVTINKSTNTLSFVGNIYVINDWTYTSGSLNFGSSTISFSATQDTTSTISGSASFYNLAFVEPSFTDSVITIASGTTLTVLGTLNIWGDDGNWGPDDLNGPGTINAQGNLTYTNDGWTGNVAITLSGNLDQTVTVGGSSEKPSGTITFNKSGGSVILASAWNLNNSGQDLLVAASSTQTLTGAFQLTVNDVTTISGTLTQATSTIQSGTFTIGSSGVWNNSSTGDIKVGSGGIGNSGAIIFTGSTGCGVTDDIAITSTSGGAARTWSGSGGFYLTDVSLQDQTTSLGLTAYSSTSVSGNSGFTFNSNCPLATAHWKFDEGYGTTAYDAVSNQADGTLSGTAVPAWKTEDMCISGKCLYFDGATSYVSVSATFPSVQSVSLWVKPNSVTSGALLDFNSGSQKITVTSGTISTSGITSPTIYVNGIESTTLVANTWNYVAVTTATPFNVALAHIGKSSSTFTQGFIDEVKIFDTQITATQIKSGYVFPSNYDEVAASFAQSNTQSLSNGLVGHWKMDEFSGNASDSSGNETILTNNGTTTFVGGKFGKAADLESGSSQDFEGISPVTIEQTAYSDLDWGVASRSVTFASIPEDNHIILLAYNQDDTTPATRTWPAGFTEFIDGGVGGSSISTLHVAWKRASGEASATYTLNLGDSNDSDQVLLGLVYSGVATSGNPYEALGSLAEHTFDDEFTESGLTTLTNRARHLILTVGGDAGTPTASGYNLDATTLPNERITVLAKSVSPAGSTGSVVVTTETFEVWTSISVALKPYVYDESLGLSSSLTTNAWIKPESNTASTSYTIAGKWDSGEEGYLLSQYGDEIRMYINSASIYAETSSANLATGTWYHVAGVYNAVTQTIKIYINGTEAASTTTGTVPSSITNTGGAFAIGAVNTLTTPANFYDGVIDEVRVYSKALNKSEINTLYAWTPGPVAYYNFDENTGTTANDLSGNGLTASGGVPATMAERTGSVTVIQSNANTGSQSISAPSDATGIVVMTGGWESGNNDISAAGTVSWDGNSLGAYRHFQNDSSDANATVIWATQISTTGSRTFAWDREGSSAVDEGGAWFVIFVKGVDWTSPIRASGGQGTGGGGGTMSTGSMAGVTGDLSLAIFVRFGTSSVTWNGAAKIGSSIDYNSDRHEIAETAPTGSHTITASGGDYLGLSAIVLKAGGTSGSGGIPAAGKFGSANTFSGSNTVTSVSESDAIDLGATTDSYTVSGWINTTTNGAGTAAIIAKNDGSGAYPYHLYLNSSEQACFQISDGTNSPSVCGSTALNNGTWHYLTGVRDVVADTLYLYVNGILVNSTTDTTTATTANDDHLTIGNSGTGYTANPFTGSIDDVKIYNYARSTKQVVQDMNAGHPTGGSPIASQVGYWKLDEQGGQTANNSGFGTSISGTLGASGSPSTDDPTWKIPGSTTCKINGCSSFDGGDFINITDSTSVRPSPITISAWVNLNVNSSDYTIINKQYGTSTNTSYLFTFNSGVLQFSVCDSGATCVTAGDLSGALPTGQWTHVAGTYDGSTAKLYKNGSLIREAVGTVTIAYDTNPVFIGARNLDASPTSPNFGFMNGYLDEIKMYNSALTADEIKIDYNAGSAAAFGGVLGTQDNEGFGGNAPLVHWPFDENTGTSTTLDKSGNENAGTLTSIVSSSWIPGKFGSGLTLDGTADYIGNTDLATSLTGDLTVGVWFKTATLPGTQSRILDLAQASTLGLQLSMVSDGRVGLDNTGGPTTGCFTTGTYHDNKWHFMQVTRSGTTYTVYVDGGVETCTDTGTAPTYDDLYVGRVSPGAGTSFFAGSVDEVKVYNYVRTAAQRAYDYNRGGPLAWYKFDECQGSTAYNAVVNANGEAAGMNGTITPGDASGDNDTVGTCDSGTSTEMWDDGTTGKRNGSLGFDGTNDYVEIADNSILRPENGSWTITAWAKPPNSNGSYSIVHKRQNSGDFEQWGLIISDQKLEGDFRQSESVERVSVSINDVADGNWHHYAMVADKDSNYVKLYVDGIEQQSTRTIDGSWPTVNNTDVLRIGEANGCCAFSGLIDDVQIFNYTVSASQIKKIYNSGSAFFGPNEGEP